MALIGKNDGVQTKQRKKVFVLPATIRNKSDEISLKKALVISIILHPMVLLFILLTTLILTLLGIDLKMLSKPDIPSKDIEFVLVEKEGTPIDKNTKYRADRNSRAGGINDPNRPVSIPSPEPKRAADPKKGGAAPKTIIKKPEKASTQTIVKKEVNSKDLAKTIPTQNANPKIPEAPVPIAPKPAAKPSIVSPTEKPNSSITIPIPKITGVAPAKLASGGPVTKSPTAGTGFGGSNGSKNAAPSFSPSATSGSLGGSGRFSGSGTGSGSGVSSGSGNIGNPGPGNPNGSPGIDAIKQADFGPYMRELQRRIKANWNPPKGNESKRVVLLFSISKDGRLLGIKVSKTSGLKTADDAAIAAVELSAPFKPLPTEYKRSSVDIQFTFDYNVFGISGY